MNKKEEELEMLKIDLQDHPEKAFIKPQEERKPLKGTDAPLPVKNASTDVVGAITKPKGLDIKGFTAEQLALIKRTVAKDASNDELQMFLHIAKKAGLDPFLKEIWFIKYRSGETIMMTGRDGFLSIAQKSGEFQGLQSAAIYEGDEFSIDYSNPIDIKIKHITNPFKKEAGKIVGGWARAARKNCIDTVEIVEWKNYYKPFAGKISMWDKFGSAMIKKTAESMALRKQYGISGLVAQEEVGYEGNESKNNIDGIKLFNDTIDLLKKVPKENIEQAKSRAITSGQFNDEQIKKIKELK